MCVCVCGPDPGFLPGSGLGGPRSLGLRSRQSGGPPARPAGRLDQDPAGRGTASSLSHTHTHTHTPLRAEATPETPLWLLKVKVDYYGFHLFSLISIKVSYMHLMTNTTFWIVFGLCCVSLWVARTLTHIVGHQRIQFLLLHTS